jgi:hypothetical protein
VRTRVSASRGGFSQSVECVEQDGRRFIVQG